MISILLALLALLSSPIAPRAAVQPPAVVRFVVPVPGTSERASISGIASWYTYRTGEAAAGPALRRFLGAGWRGMWVRVCAARCTVVRLTDYMVADRLVDLDRRSFAALAPLSRGLVDVRITVA